MTSNNNCNPKNSLVLFGLNNIFLFLKKLFDEKKFPNVCMLSGKKGIGKFTLINHFLNYVFENNRYDLQKMTIDKSTDFYKMFTNDNHQNIIHLKGENFKNIKIDDIRNLKSVIQKTNISDNERFIILDDIELFNTQSLNALLKIIEEPTTKNYFILINNKTKPLIETIKSRSLEIKVIISNNERIEIIESIINKNKLDVLIDYKSIDLTPGNFLLFNNICETLKIDINDDLVQNINQILNTYKKNKTIDLINMILYLNDYYFLRFKQGSFATIEKNNEKRMFIANNINKYLMYNINQNSLINVINNKLTDE